MTRTAAIATTALAVGCTVFAPSRRADAQHHHRHHDTSHHEETPPPAATVEPPASAGVTTTTTSPTSPVASPSNAARRRPITPPPPPPPAPTPPPDGEPHETPLRMQPGHHDSSLELEVHGFFAMGFWGWPWNGFAVGPGVRLGIPLMRNGPISTINNDWRIVFGVDAYFWLQPEFYVAFAAPIALQWNFFLTNTWSVFVEAGGQVELYPTQGLTCYDHPQYYCDVVTFHPYGGVGARIHLGGAGRFPTFTFRFDYPSGFTAGASF